MNEQEPRLNKFVDTIVVPAKGKNEKLKQHFVKVMTFQKEKPLSELIQTLNQNLISLNTHKSGAGEKCKDYFHDIWIDKRKKHCIKRTTLLSVSLC